MVLGRAAKATGFRELNKASIIQASNKMMET